MVRPVKNTMELEYYFYICSTLHIALYYTDTNWFENFKRHSGGLLFQEVKGCA